MTVMNHKIREIAKVLSYIVHGETCIDPLSS